MTPVNGPDDVIVRLPTVLNVRVMAEEVNTIHVRFSFVLMIKRVPDSVEPVVSVLNIYEKQRLETTFRN